jgi:hypothetical protein
MLTDKCPTQSFPIFSGQFSGSFRLLFKDIIICRFTLSEIHLAAGEVSGLDPGTYRYIPDEHTLVQEIAGDKRAKLSKAAPSQPMEAGHAAQNVYFLGTELGIGTCVVSTFDDEKVKKCLNCQ